MTCFCSSTHAAQITLIILAWLGCLAEIALLVFLSLIHISEPTRPY